MLVRYAVTGSLPRAFSPERIREFAFAFAFTFGSGIGMGSSTAVGLSELALGMFPIPVMAVLFVSLSYLSGASWGVTYYES